MGDALGRTTWSEDEPPCILYRRRIDDEVQLITEAAMSEHVASEELHIPNITILNLLEAFIQIESRGHPVTHIIVDAATFADMRQWEDLKHQSDVQWRAAGWYATLWTVKIYVREFGEPHRVFVGSLVDGMNDCATRFTIASDFAATDLTSVGLMI